MSAGFLPDQLADLLYGQDNKEGDPLNLAVVWQAIEDALNGDPESLDWIKRAERAEGGFGWYAGQLRRQPEKLSKAIVAWIAEQTIK